ncbi:MAG: Protein Rep [Candidatus Collierbacteria bacterium GW2011_GWF2_44_15]|uniref:Protein Rep n=4 Tax=Candidatus Collieribacteriota TaxID=1752725 RepID=A0A0G1HF22_9BACT|nr:MAG: Protein Rep [Candidatus Collierbacteria bacterium GW2011_GWA1_44_12]KKT45485.1 MAG: Protein Rep [Candidatus Collierbacteria bacterium GW2011_GWF2_44_15]KKT97217.1 MAG: Protein Rep [Candidatus Collierbacteria bacterium GW2011_GWC2_45_15]KKU30210.1 MAG: Protein Rep [Candidatus Collierbacteria bacterium GW2011_GWE1_46_18]
MKKRPLRLDSNVISRPNFTDKKVIVSGNLVEEYTYGYPLKLNIQRKSDFRKKNSGSSRNKEYKGRSVNKARNTIRRLAQANFNGNSKFLTLTFNNENTFDISSITECDKKFRLFIKQIKKLFLEHMYIAVREFQERGAVHYHLLSNIPYIKKKELASIWGYGFVGIKKVTNVIGIGAYISKYLSKDFEDKRFKGLRTYITSLNLKRPITYYGNEANSIIGKLIEDGESPYFENKYMSNYNGEISFREYNRINFDPARKDNK